MFKPFLCNHTESFLFHYIFLSFILLKSKSNIFVTAYMFWLAKHLSSQQFNQIQTNIYFLLVSFSVFYKQSTAKLHFKGPWPFLGLQCIESLRLRGTSGLWLNFLPKTGSIRLLSALSNSVLKTFKVTDSTTYLGNLFQELNIHMMILFFLNQNFACLNLCPVLFTLLLCTSVKCMALSSQEPPLKYREAAIRSPRGLHFFHAKQFNYLRLTLSSGVGPL